MQLYGWKPVGLLSELIVLINDNNDNAVHDVYRTKSWTVLVVTVTAKIATIKCLIVYFHFCLFSIEVGTIIALGIQ